MVCPLKSPVWNFHQTDRAVKSLARAGSKTHLFELRQPLENYEHDLEELIEVLEPLLLEKDPEDRPAF